MLRLSLSWRFPYRSYSRSALPFEVTPSKGSNNSEMSRCPVGSPAHKLLTLSMKSRMSEESNRDANQVL